MAVHNVDGLELNVDRGPNWLFVKLRTREAPKGEVPQFAEKLWSISSRHFIYRLVLELENLEEMPSGMMGQLVMLQERLSQCGGALRICPRRHTAKRLSWLGWIASEYARRRTRGVRQC